MAQDDKECIQVRRLRCYLSCDRLNHQLHSLSLVIQSLFRQWASGLGAKMGARIPGYGEEGSQLLCADVLW